KSTTILVALPLFFLFGAGCQPKSAGPSCKDGIKNAGETDVDCGGAICPPCGVGKKCAGSRDCSTNACDLNSQTCVADQCADHQMDGGETGVDCGGAVCTPC